ncbi:hypothetical protein CLOSTMETH_01495 [[Clostridium] methylpentosum DSM 5476]|uniref:Uncharacterized protein n=1 Tax=[Clostridium] methylpentosum DSM 5476 TaxID=537013 RepID=C0ECC6_9FIRM|nr:hypothetical protein CLOSTMETH_01495 [[Clostridium] methylpentosum DSM 5476]
MALCFTGCLYCFCTHSFDKIPILLVKGRKNLSEKIVKGTRTFAK